MIDHKLIKICDGLINCCLFDSMTSTKYFVTIKNFV